MQDLAVTLVQCDIYWENPEANRNSIEEQLAAAEHIGDLIILPEMFTTGFTMNAKQVAEPMNFHSIKWMHQLAMAYDATVLGSIVIMDNGNYYNRLCVVNNAGLAGYYDKRHLFRKSGENETYTAGTERLGFNIKGWNIMPFICYDLRFPVWSRNVDNTFDLLVYVANWPASRIKVWDNLLLARSIENLVYCVGVNRVGSDHNSIEYNGHSSIQFPDGETILHLGNEVKVETKVLSKLKLEEFRNSFPAQKDADEFELIIE